MTSTAGLPVARSSAGVRTRSLERITRGTIRPSAETASCVMATGSEVLWTWYRKSTTS